MPGDLKWIVCQHQTPVLLAWAVLLFVTVSGCATPIPPPSVPCAPGPPSASCFWKQDPAKQSTKLIVFTPGVFGDRVTTWGQPQSKSFWPAMIDADTRFKDEYDVYLMNYPAPYVGPATNFQDTAAHELGLLKSHGVFRQYQHIVFITHSMGGVVVKSLLIRLNRGADTALLRQVEAVVFLATPSQGAKLADWESWLSLNPQLDEMVRGRVSTDIQSLENQWVQLINDREKVYKKSPRAYCFYEALHTDGVWIVPREQARSRCDGPLSPLSFDHMHIAEPTRPDTDPYLWVMSKVYDVDQEAQRRDGIVMKLQRARRLSSAGQHQEALTAFQNTLIAAKTMDMSLQRGEALEGIGQEESALGRQEQARVAYTGARAFYRAEQSRLREANVLRGLGDLEQKLGRHEQARVAYTDARALYQAVQNRLGEANVLMGLGGLDQKLDRHDEASKAYTDARALYRAEQSRLGEASALAGLGDLEQKLGRHDEARRAYIDARVLYHAEQNRLGEASMLAGLGGVEQKLSRYDEARRAYADARALYQTEQDRLGEAKVLVGLGFLESQKNPDGARQHFSQSASLFEALDMKAMSEMAKQEAENIKSEKPF